MFDTGSMNKNLFLYLHFWNTMDVLFWSIVLDIVVAIKITFYSDCLLTFEKQTWGDDHSPPWTIFL